MATTGNKRATNSTKKKPLDGRTKAGKVMSGKYDAKKKQQLTKEDAETPDREQAFLKHHFKMPLTTTQRNQIASYKVQIESYRKDLQRLKDEKKRKSEYYGNMIKGTKDPNSKRSYRQSKIQAMNTLVNSIEGKKRDIERIKGYIQNIKGYPLYGQEKRADLTLRKFLSF